MPFLRACKAKSFIKSNYNLLRFYEIFLNFPYFLHGIGTGQQKCKQKHPLSKGN